MSSFCAAMEQTAYKMIRLPSPDYVQLHNERQTFDVGLMIRAPRKQAQTHKKRGAYLPSKHQGALSCVPASRKRWLNSEEEPKIFTRVTNSCFLQTKVLLGSQQSPPNQSGVFDIWNLSLFSSFHPLCSYHTHIPVFGLNSVHTCTVPLCYL